jgi:hypothetical protein
MANPLIRQAVIRAWRASERDIGKDSKDEVHVNQSSFNPRLTVKYRFPIEIRRRSEIRLRDEVCISKTKGSRCRRKYRSLNGILNPYTGSEGAWLQLVRCALLYAWCPISERDSEEDRRLRGRV